MGKANKNKKNKVPKISEEQYAAYIAQLKEGIKTPVTAVCGQGNVALLGTDNKQK